MDLPSILQICATEDTKLLDQLTDSIPLYPYLREIFHLIISEEKPRLFAYIVSYIKTHPLNQIPGLAGEFYFTWATIIAEIGLYHLIKADAPDDEIYNHIETHMIPRIHTSFDFYHSEVLVKIMMLKPPERIINILTNTFITLVLDIHSRPEYQYKNKADSFIDFNADKFWRISIRNIYFGQYSWKIVMKMKGEDLKKFLDLYFKIDNDLTGLIKAGGKELLKFILKHYNPILEDFHYTHVCSTGDFDLAIYLLNYMMKTDFTADQFLDSQILIGQINLRVFKNALINSYVSNNHQLIKFNTEIITRVFESPEENEKAIREYKHQYQIDEFLKKYTLHDIDSEFSQYYFFHNSNIISDLQKILIHLEKHQIKALLVEEFDFDIVFAIYHSVEWGYKGKIGRLEFQERDDYLTSEKMAKCIPAITNYFDKKNIALKKEIMKLTILFPVLLNLVYEYIY